MLTRAELLNAAFNSPPPNPIVGQIWLDISDVDYPIMKTWSGTDWVLVTASVQEFTQLSDTPGALTGSGGNLLRVSNDENSIEFLDAPPLNNLSYNNTTTLGVMTTTLPLSNAAGEVVIWNNISVKGTGDAPPTYNAANGKWTIHKRGLYNLKYNAVGVITSAVSPTGSSRPEIETAIYINGVAQSGSYSRMGSYSNIESGSFRSSLGAELVLLLEIGDEVTIGNSRYNIEANGVSAIDLYGLSMLIQEMPSTAWVTTAFAGPSQGTVEFSFIPVGDADVYLTLPISKVYHIISVTSSQPSWLRIYQTDANRTNDAARGIDVDPSNTAGVVAEYIFDAYGTILSNPIPTGSSTTGNVPIAVRNTADVPVGTTLTIQYIEVEI